MEQNKAFLEKKTRRSNSKVVLKKKNMTLRACVDTIKSAMEQNVVSTSNERRLRRELKLNATEWNQIFMHTLPILHE